MFLLLIVFAPVCAAQAERSSAEADRMYHDVGAQLFCICGCRENLLTCSHNTCSAKDQERAFLRELSQDATLDAPAIRAAMAKRFGNEVLQVQESSSLYPILGVSGIVLMAAFGAGFFVLTRRDDKPADDTKPEPVDSEMEERIANELKELE